MDHFLLGALYAALAIAAVVFLFVAHLRFWARRLHVPLDYETHEELPTPDGARIEVRRLPIPDGTQKLPLPPILLVHGMGANHRNIDLHARHSLARHLAALGRDVWLLTLRTGLAPRTRGEARRLHFSAMVTHDVPMGVEAVRSRTGAAQVDYVGFSMGGMLLYAALGRTLEASHLRRAVIVASPGRLSPLPALLRPLARRLPRWMVPRGPARLGARGIAFASEWVRTPIHHMLLNPHNMLPGFTRATLVNMVEDIPAALNAEFLEWTAVDGEIRIDGARVLAGLADVDVPALFFAGSVDRVAPEGTVRTAFEAWGKDKPLVVKRFVVLGRDHGHRADYGHADMTMGPFAATDLFEPIATFLGP